MSLIVHKYGGTSVGSPERIKNVARRVAKWHRAGHRVVVVVSAMSGETNRLIDLARQIQPAPDPRELDVIAATGEQVTIGLLAMALKAIGIPARSYTGAQVRVLTDSAFTKARISAIDRAAPAAPTWTPARSSVVAGFQGVDADGNITTLGRGGSDTSAVALAAALQGRRMPDLHRRRRRLHDRPAHRCRGAAPAHGHLRGNARDGQPGLQGAADPLGGVRRQVPRAPARALEPDGPGHAAGRGSRIGHADHF